MEYRSVTRIRSRIRGKNQWREAEKFMSPSEVLLHRHIPAAEWCNCPSEDGEMGTPVPRAACRHFAPRLYWPRLAGIGVETRRPIGTSLRLSFVPPGEIDIRER